MCNFPLGLMGLASIKKIIEKSTAEQCQPVDEEEEAMPARMKNASRK